MEKRYEACVRKVQYQVKCFDSSREEHCILLNQFVQECTLDLLGECLTASTITFVLRTQQAALSMSPSLLRLGLEPECWGVPKSALSNSDDLERKRILVETMALEPFIKRRRLAIE